MCFADKIIIENPGVVDNKGTYRFLLMGTLAKATRDQCVFWGAIRHFF